jgi:putative ABC transport system ATP-binding protein
VLLPDESVLPILTGVDLEVGPGEHVSIVGRSGSGKSTLLNLLGLLDTPTAGTYLLDGEPTGRLRPRRRSRLRGEVFGFVFQQFNLLPRRTAVENVAAPLLYARGRDYLRRRRAAAEMLDLVGLGARADRFPSGSPAASSSEWRSPARWSAVPGSSSPTSPPAPSTSRPVRR